MSNQTSTLYQSLNLFTFCILSQNLSSKISPDFSLPSANPHYYYTGGNMSSVADRTRSKFVQRCNEIRGRHKVVKSPVTGATAPEENTVPPAVVFDIDKSEDEGLLNKKRKSSSFSRKDGKGGCGKLSDDHLDEDERSENCNSCKKLKIDEERVVDSDDEQDSLSDEKDGSDVVVVSEFDLVKNKDGELIDDGQQDSHATSGDDDDVVEIESNNLNECLSVEKSDSDVVMMFTSTEDESEESDDSYKENDIDGEKTDEVDSDDSDDDVKCKENDIDGENTDDVDSDDDECMIAEKNDVKCKGDTKIVEGRQRGNFGDKEKKETVEDKVKGEVDSSDLEISNDKSNYENGKMHHIIDVDTDEEENVGVKNKRNFGMKNEDRVFNSGNMASRLRSRSVKKSEMAKPNSRKDSSSVRKPEMKKVNSRKDGKPISEPEVLKLDISSSSSSESDGVRVLKSVTKDGGKKRRNVRKTTRKRANKFDPLTILCDSLNSEGDEVTPSIKKPQEPIYKFRFKDKDANSEEKSEFEKDIDNLWKELDTLLACDRIGSTPIEVDNGYHVKTHTDWPTSCSQGIHHLVLDEQIGIICKYCSHVHQEIKHVLPAFSTPPSQRYQRGYYRRSESVTYSDYFKDTGAEKHSFENYDKLGTVWDLVPGCRNSMYEHQREGFEFIWKHLAGGTVIKELEKPLTSPGSGCIISHAPGTGKTRLTIVFLQSFMKLYPDSRPVIIAPKSMLMTWEEEFKKWKVDIPFHNLNNLEFSGQEHPTALSLSNGVRGSRNNETLIRLVKLWSWKKYKSILGLTYALFDKLVGGATRNVESSPIVEQMGKVLLKFPTLLVLDEGHTPRNDESYIYNSLLGIETDRRIILSGTPFQNNFMELYNTMCLVNPDFGRTLSKHGGSMMKKWRKISKELKSKSASKNFSSDDDHKVSELKKMIIPFVHSHKGTILEKSCPGLKDALIVLQPTDLQQELISLLRRKKEKCPMVLSHAISVVSVHPSLLPDKFFSEPEFSLYRDRLKRLQGNPYIGAKTKFVMELCRLSEALNEKVLIYGQYIDPLLFMKKQFQTSFNWIEGREVLYMDGGLEPKQRQSSISALNDPNSKARVLLASIKACSEGIHLVGASRVVLLDVVWNPSVERQAISRAYRIGQKKMVYTYHLISDELEVNRYNQQIAKDRLSELVFSSKDMDSCNQVIPDDVHEDEILQEMFQRNDKLGGLFKQIIYQPKESYLVDKSDLFAEH